MIGGFPLERILTISARDYVESQDRSLKDYHMVGVHTEIKIGELNEHICSVFPEDTEVIVDYKVVQVYKNRVCAYGTALIPKAHGTGTRR